jgi:hypothetical protein
MTYSGPCMCGATDCRSCGPAQGYEVERVWDTRQGRYVWRNPEPDEPPVPQFEFTANPGTRFLCAAVAGRGATRLQALIDTAYCLDAPDWLPTPDIELAEANDPELAYITNVFIPREQHS